MDKIIKVILVYLALTSLSLFPRSIPSAETILEKKATEAMMKATQFYYHEVSTGGGYLFEYTTDMQHCYGEMPARPSQIWVQDPATPGVGQAYLDAWEATGEPLFLEAAEEAARALIIGQLDCGGWNYLIDFKDGDIEDWYQHEGHHPDFNEFSHYDGNATFDDHVIYNPVLFLMRLYGITSDSEFLEPLQKALDFVLEAQFPNGAWPQRYPLVGDGYETYYTFNDDVIQSTIELLIEAHRFFGEGKYLDAARRGADFIVISRHEGPQYGWGLQYTPDMKLAWARAMEPPSISPSCCIRNVNVLMDIYEYTGDRSYLDPIPECLDWLDSVISPTGTIGAYLEETTNRPLAAMYVGDSGSYESIQLTYDLSKAMGGYGFTLRNFSTKPERNRYASLVSSAWVGPPSPPPPLTGISALNEAWKLETTARRTMYALDELGRWTENGRLYSERFCYKNVYEYTGPVMENGWIRTRTFIKNMGILSQYVLLMKNGRQTSSVSSDVAGDFTIDGINPNPFNSQTSINFTLPSESPFVLAIYTVTGQRVRSLAAGTMAPGKHRIVWNGKDDSGRAVAAGIYVAGLVAGKNRDVLRMVLLN